MWCKLKVQLNEIKLLEESIKRGVIYVPGSTLGTNKEYIRFTFARENEESIQEGIKRFADAVRSL
ncbi:hypothetical protein ACFWDG_22455 [Peribacillus sp. NPDC060186]